MPVGNHSGAYFGPYNTLGEKFNDLTKYEKERNGVTQEVQPTVNNTTPFEPGNTVHTYEENGKLNIKVLTIVTQPLIF